MLCCFNFASPVGFDVCFIAKSLRKNTKKDCHMFGRQQLNHQRLKIYYAVNPSYCEHL